MTYHLNKLLSTVSVLPALLVLPVFGDPISVSTLSELNTAMTAGSDILVSQDITVSGGLGVTGQTNTVNLNGMTLSGGDGDTNGLSIFSGSLLNLVNGGTISGFDRSGTSAGIMNIQESALYLDGNFTFQNNNSQRGVIQVWGNTDAPVVSSSATSVLLFDNNTSTMGGALYHEHRHSGDDVVSELQGTSITFSNNSATSTAGGAVLNVVGNLSILGDSNTFTGNQTTAEIISNHYKRGGGAIANASGDGTNGATMIIGNADSVNTFSGNASTTNGGAIMNRAVDSDRDAYLTINGTSTFSGNSAAEKGGAIYNISQQIETQSGEDNWVSQKRNELNLIGTSNVFSNNVAGHKGGAIYTSGYATIDNALFTGNHTTGAAYTEFDVWQQAQGGAIYNTGSNELFEDDSDVYWAAEGILNISNTNFGVDGDALSGNSALQGGAIANNSGMGGFYDGNIVLNNTNFYNNRAYADLDDDGYNFASLGGAIWNDGIITVNGDTVFKGNTAEGFDASGGAIYNLSSGTLTFNDAVTFDSNMASAINASSNGAFGGAIYNTSDITFADMVTFTNNIAVDAVNPTLPIENKYSQGGALRNSGTTTMTGGALFSSNRADLGGAIYNTGTVDMTDVTFTDNIANQRGAAIYNKGIVNISALNENVVFHNNTVNGQVYDIYNVGTLNLDAAASKAISIEGVQGNSGTINKTGDGVLNVSEYIAFQTVNLDEGELHLTTGEDNLYQSTINVASGATINTIDDLINDYASSIVLSDGAIVKGDLDYTNGLADLYSAIDGATIIYSMANPLDIGIQYGASKTIQVATGNNVTVNAGTGFAWFDGDHGLTLASSGAADGSVVVTGTSGGINAAVDAADTGTGMHNEIAYFVTSDETFDGFDNVIQNANFAIVGNGTDGNTLTLGGDLIVDTDSSLSISDAILAQATDSEKIQNRLGAVLNINDSYIGVDIDNAGILLSDPTTYTGTITNTGTANFAADTFDDTATLANSGTVNLANGVVFNSGAAITGGGVVNLVNGVTQFNNTASSNIINIANGADFSGTLVSTGVVNSQNNNIDTVTGSVSGGTLNVDATLIGAGAVDTFADATGATISSINLLSSEYGDAASLTMDVHGATLADDFTVTGATNYYTDVSIDSSGNLVFGDKLLNTSGFYDLVDANWSGGHYILNAATYGTAADATHLTVGDALAALDAQVYENETTISGKVNTSSVYTASVGPEDEIENSDSLVMSVTSFQNSIVNMAENTSINWAQTQGFDGGITIGENYGITSAGVATLGATTVSSVTMGGVTTSGIYNGSAQYNSTNDADKLITAGAVYSEINDINTALGHASNGTETAATGLFADVEANTAAIQTLTGSGANSITGQITSALNASGFQNSTQIASAVTDGAQNATYNSATSYGANTIGGAISQNAADIEAINAALGHASNGTETAATGLFADVEANTAAIEQNATDIANINTALGHASNGTETAATGLFADVEANTAAIQTLTGSGANSITGQITSALNASGFQNSTQVASAVTDGAQNATYDAGGTYADNTIGAAIQSNASAIQANTTAIETLTGDGVGSISSQISSALSGIGAVSAEDATYDANSGHASGTIGAEIDEINTVLGRPADDDNESTGLFARVESHSTAIDTLNGDESVNGSVANQVATALALNTADIAQRDALTLGQANAYTDSRVETLDKNLSSGIASAVALSSVAVGGLRRGEMSVGAGYGYFNGQSAAAFGAAVGLSSRWSINAGAGVSGYDVSFRAGTNFKFKVF